MSEKFLFFKDVGHWILSVLFTSTCVLTILFGSLRTLGLVLPSCSPFQVLDNLCVYFAYYLFNTIFSTFSTLLPHLQWLLFYATSNISFHNCILPLSPLSSAEILKLYNSLSIVSCLSRFLTLNWHHFCPYPVTPIYFLSYL